MKFKALQENLRKELWKRIDAKQLTGLRLADQTGFKQAHISNFLNRKRQLSLDGLDKVLTVQHISVLDLLDPSEINKRASILPPSDDDFENVLLVEGRVAAGEPLVTNEDVKEILKFKKTFLKRLRADMAAPRDDWRRFVLVKVDERDGMSMFPRLLPGSTVLIDRHYNSLAPYRKNDKNMYAVRKDGGCTIKYVDQDGNNLVLRPHNHDYPSSVIALEEGKTVADFIVGRVCHVANET
ncbi:MAG TPA: XRE family transcriptional regulator [Terriglobales bacterium]|nr:XRE family transcriptional regulator [Terriglobales bacterium]